MEPSLAQTEDALRAARSEPRAEFVRELEASLHSRSRRRRRLGTLVAAGALSTWLAALTLVLSITGLLPWGVGQSRSVEGGERVQDRHGRAARAPADVVVDADGKIRTEHRVVAVVSPSSVARLLAVASSRRSRRSARDEIWSTFASLRLMRRPTSAVVRSAP